MKQYLALNRKNTAICDNMDETGGYYTKWNKLFREGQILHDITFMWNLKKIKESNSYK